MKNGPQQKEKFRLLHVDDNYDALRLFQMKMKGLFDVTSANSAVDAMDILKVQDFDAVVTDYDMPDKNGLQLLKMIKERHPRLPVIFYTGQGNEEVAREAFMNGVSDYLTKNRHEIAHSEKLINSIYRAVEAKRAGEELKESHRRFSTLIDNVPGIVYRCKNDKNWTMEFMNENVFELTGYWPQELIDNREISYASLIHPDERPKVWEAVQKGVKSKQQFTIEYRIITRKGRVKHVLEKGRGVYGENGEMEALEGVILDDTTRKQSQKNLIQLNRVLLAVRDINRLIVREKKPDKLLSRACEILVKYRGYCMAWVGMVEDGSPYIIPIASAGKNQGFLEKVRMPLSIPADELCPIGKAIKTGQITSSRNIEHDSTCSFWKLEALTRGYRSGAFLPIKLKGRIFGTLNVFSESPYVFDVLELDLLKELTDDISFALQAIEDEEKRNRAEEALKESEIRYRSLFEQANDAVFLETLDGRILDVNKKACQMLGYTKEELLNLATYDLLPAEAAKELPKIIEALKHGKSIFEETQNVKKDGTLIDVDASISAMKIGNKTRVLTLIRNITDKKRAKMEMERLKNRFQLVIENTPMVALQGFDKSGKIIHWNKESERIYGLPKESAVGREIQELTCREQKVKEFQHKIDEVIRTRQPSPTYEWKVRSSDGATHWVLSTIFPVVENDEIAELFCVEVDITSRKTAEKSMTLSEERYRGIIENMTNGVLTCKVIEEGKDGIITGWNREAEEIFGMKKDVVVGRRITEVFPASVDVGFIKGIEQVWKTGRPKYMEPKLYRDRVYEQWIEYIIYKIPSSDEIVAIMDEVTDRIESEVALKEFSDRMTLLIDSQKDIIFETDEEGVFTFTSPATEEIIGYKPQEMIGRKFSHFVTDESYSFIDGFFNENLIEKDKAQSGRYHTFECNARHKNGEVRHLTVNVKLVFDQQGLFCGTRGSIRDVTEAVKAAEALKKSEEKYRVIFESAEDSIFILDKDCRFISVNKAAARAMHKNAEEMIGMHMTDVFPEETAQSQAKAVKEIFKTGRPVIAYERDCPTPAGIKYYNTTLTPLKDEKGNVTAVLGIARDVTEIKQNEETCERMDTILSSTEDSIIVLDRDGNIISANKVTERNLGVPLEKIVNQNVQKFYGERNISRGLSYLKDVFKTGETKIEKDQYFDTAMGRKWFDILLTPMSNKDGEVTAVIGIARDVTAVKEASHALKETQRLTRTILDSAPFGLAMSTPDGKVSIFNKEMTEITGYTKEEIPDQHTWFNTVYEPGTSQKMLQQWKHDVENKAFNRGWRHLTLIRKDGKKVEIEAIAQKLENGEMIIFVTERDRAVDYNIQKTRSQKDSFT